MMGDIEWSEWYPIDLQSVTALVPDKPGVYEVRADFEFGRLKGHSRIVTIGSANRSLRQRLIRQRFANTERFMNRAEKLLYRAGHTLEFRYATTAGGQVARQMEAKRLEEYEKEHWELPPGNGQLPR
jgi:hypothetical protein